MEKHTILQVREQLGKQVLGHNANVGLDMVIQDQTRRECGLVVTAPPYPPPADDTTACFRCRHCEGLWGSLKITRKRGVPLFEIERGVKRAGAVAVEEFGLLCSPGL